MSRLDRRVDGITIDNWEARFTGRIPLENEELEAATVDNTVVLVIVAHQDGMNVTVNKRTGDLTRTNVMKVTDARLIEGELRSVLVEKLGLYGSDTVDPPMVKPEPAIADEDQMELPFQADEDTGEVQTFGTVDSGAPAGVEVVGTIKANGPQGSGRHGVIPFNPTAGPAGPTTGETVGHINNTRRDPALASFMDDV